MKFERVFAVAACVVVALGLVLAFLLIGPPSHARLVALDQQRVRALDSIASQMHDQFSDTKDSLPRVLPGELAKRDPVTGRPYEYTKLDAMNYTLCARFSAAAESVDVEQSSPGQFWPHGAGRTCYQFNVTAAEVAPHVVRQ